MNKLKISELLNNIKKVQGDKFAILLLQAEDKIETFSVNISAEEVEKVLKYIGGQKLIK